MQIDFFSKNGEILPTREAMVALSNIEYAYGFGIYETIRVSHAIPHFLSEHLDRLLKSAEIIELEHVFTKTQVEKFVTELVIANKIIACNVKILLIGGANKDLAQLYIQCLPPLFPDKKLYKNGASVITAHYERVIPHAKTLNMLQSYMAYRYAKKQECYDALLINRLGFITEGTRTNFFAIKGKTIYSPSEKEILLGVTRDSVLRVAKENGYTVQEANISVSDLSDYDGAFLTSTSSKIIPIKKIDGFEFGDISDETKKLMVLFDNFLEKV